MKKFFPIVFTSVFILLFSRAALASPQNTAQNTATFKVHRSIYSVSGTVYRMDAEPFIENNQVYIPLRYLAYSLGINEKGIIWHQEDKSVELNTARGRVRLVVGSNFLYINDKVQLMDCAPTLRGDYIFLPAGPFADALRYSHKWDEETGSILIGPPGGNFQAIDLDKAAPVKIRPFQGSDSDIYECVLSSSSIFFPYSLGESENVYNAGVAAKYINGLTLEPGNVFSFNKVVGIRTTSRGFITGKNIWEKPDVGGGICRMSTALYQAATKAGLKILERRPHSLPVHYAPNGDDAQISWGQVDLKFKNTSPYPLTIYSELMEESDGRLLTAELIYKEPLQKVEVAVLRKKPGANLWENIEKDTLTALVKGDTSYVSTEQLGDMLQHPFKKEEDGSLTILVNGKLVNFREGTTRASINGSEYILSEPPLILKNNAFEFWLPLRDWASITETEVIWIDREHPLILLNMSGTPVAEEI
ncbi:MAG: VanW family protein [Bacillota bacterium]